MSKMEEIPKDFVKVYTGYINELEHIIAHQFRQNYPDNGIYWNSEALRSSLLLENNRLKVKLNKRFISIEESKQGEVHCVLYDVLKDFGMTPEDYGLLKQFTFYNRCYYVVLPPDLAFSEEEYEQMKIVFERDLENIATLPDSYNRYKPALVSTIKAVQKYVLE